jgi:PAS domain-containing protein
MPASLQTPLSSGFSALGARLLVRARRLRNEGFGWFLASVLLFATSSVLLRTYYNQENVLEHAVQDEILATVGTQQEPSENTSELGLIAAALAPINRDPALRSGVVPPAGCDKDDAVCRAVLWIEHHVALEIYKGLENNPTPANTVLRHPVINSPRPELGTASSCLDASSLDPSALIVPAQMRDFRANQPDLPERIRRWVAVSAGLGSTIEAARAQFERDDAFTRIVQVYFISPDSVLRIWSSRASDVCATFDQYRLWASKSYATYFWSHPEKASYLTEAYIDYGGNGLVQTRCIPIEERRPDDSPFLHGRLFGVLCSDVKLPDRYLNTLRRQLFFETAAVVFSVNANDPPDVRADATLPPRVTHPRAGSSQLITTVALAAMGGEAASRGPRASPVLASAARATDTDVERAIEMQPLHMNNADIQAAIGSRIRNADFSALGRGPTRLPFADHDAFLLPVGAAPAAECGGRGDQPCQRAIFFYPRNPVLKDKIKWCGALGYALFGMSLIAGAVGIRLRPRSEELRERLSILRNLQVGVIRADHDSMIVEANDRAEELFGRRLPKYQPDRRGLWSKAIAAIGRGNARRAPRQPITVKFFDLIDACLQERQERTGGEAQYVPISEEDILRLRNLGGSSSYYARLRPRLADTQPPKGRWLRVAATPMMLARQDRAEGVELSHVFATISEVDRQVAVQLDRDLGSE